MKKDSYERTIRIVDKVLAYCRAKWFLCFGNILHLIRDRSIENDHDIDIGVFYEDMNKDLFVRGFLKWEYKLKKIIVNDVSKNPFYLSFEYVGRNFKLPPLDIFAWYLHGKKRYHTYDVDHEGKKVPSIYTFKGVKDDWLPRHKLPLMRDDRIVRAFFGSKKEPIFRFPINVPLKYGTLLDCWYPDWLIPKLGDETGWPMVELSLDLTNRHNLRLRVGAEKGGLVCSGGVCRFEEPFKGVKLVLTSIF